MLSSRLLKLTSQEKKAVTKIAGTVLDMGDRALANKVSNENKVASFSLFIETNKIIKMSALIFFFHGWGLNPFAC